MTARVGEADDKGRIRPLASGENDLLELLTAFFQQQATTVATAKDLAKRMAGTARIIHELIVGTFNHDKEQGWLHNWLAAFRETLIPDLGARNLPTCRANAGLRAVRRQRPRRTK